MFQKANDTNFQVGDYVRMREKPHCCGIVEQIGAMIITVKLTDQAHIAVGAPKWRWERDPSKPKDPKKVRERCECGNRAEVMMGSEYICRRCATLQRKRKKVA
jgi:hypothetical protein